MSCQPTLPGFDGLLDEANLREAWRRVPGHGDDDFERFMQYPGVRKALMVMVLQDKKRRAKRCQQNPNRKRRA